MCRPLPVATALLPLVLVLLQACAAETEKNTAPSAPTVSIGPVSPRTGDDLVAVVRTESADDQGDAVTYSYAWLQDGVPRADLTADRVPASETTKGELWEVTVTPDDGELTGNAATASATIVNTPPEVTLAFSPTAPTSDEDLIAVPTATDADGDAVIVSYSWTLDGGPDDTVTDTITADRTARGQRWGVTVTPADEEEPGTPVTTEVEIANSAPVMLSAVLTPSGPFVTDGVVAAVESSDADGDPVAYTYTWFVDGSEVQSGESDTLSSGSFAKHQLVNVEVVPNDGFDDGGAMASADAEVLNSVPTVSSASIDPATAFEASTLTCVPAGFADADGDTLAWTYGWSVNDVDVSSASTLDGTAFAKGDAVVCTAMPFDDEESGEPVASAALVVSNSAPVLVSADLSTYAPTENDTITVTLGAATDADGDSISYGYEWYVDGSLVTTSTELPSDKFGKGDSIYVVVTPWDGFDSGSPVASAVATAANTPPTLSSVTLSPTNVYTDDTLTATVSASDLDGDTVSLSYAWTVDGAAIAATGSTLAGTWFEKDETVVVTVTPDDGTDTGASASSTSVTILNSPPTAPTIGITPSSPEAGVDELRCEITSAATDADGDSVSYTASWTVGGAAYTAGGGTVSGGEYAGWEGADTTSFSGDTVPVVDLRFGQVWECTVSANDGTDWGDDATDSVEVTDPALTGWWPLEGGLAEDMSGNNFDGTVSGAVNTTGQVDQALSFDGVDDRISIGTSSAFSFTSEMTVAAWVKGASASSVGSVVTRRSCCGDATTFQWSLQNNDGDMAFGVYTASAVTWAGGASYSLNDWTFFVGVYDGAELRLYQDGALVSTATETGSIAARTFETVLGARDDDAGYSDYWRVALDEVRLWDRALLPEEIQQIYDEEM